ncbi:MAG: precorrin-8X methylmutase [Pseudomonadales bacterium]|nr:precorrin-8X methylmutase [Pseudomonadales bacterium]
MTKVTFQYEKNPTTIEIDSFNLIRAATDLSAFSVDEAQVVMRLVHTCGDPAIAQKAFISEKAVEVGIDAVANNAAILCDVEMVRHGLTKRMINTPPLCYLNDEDVPALAKAAGESRTMAALSKWHDNLAGSIVLIGNAPTALFRLLEMLQDGAPKPALVIGIPVGFVGAPESKDALVKYHKEFGIECITVTGRQGGSALTAGTFNTLLRLQRGIRF